MLVELAFENGLAECAAKATALSKKVLHKLSMNLRLDVRDLSNRILQPKQS